MAQRTAFLNSDAKGFNKDFHHTWISNYMLKQPGVMFSNYSTKPEFALGNGQISGGKAIIRCTRTTGTFAGEEILACFESTSTENISTAGNKKVYIEIPEVYVNDSTAITDSLTQGANLNVGRIVSSDSYPTHSNYIPLWEITNGDWQNATDLRPEVLRRGKPNTLSYFGGNGEEERIDIDNASLNKYLMSNGAGVAPSWEEGGGGGGGSGENFKRTFTADEDLLAKSMFGVAAQTALGEGNNTYSIGIDDGFTKFAFGVILNGEDFSSINLYLAAINSPADTLSVRIETVDASGNPTGTLVDVGAYGTATPTDTMGSVTVSMAGTITGLTNHTKAAVVIYRTGSVSNSNYFNIQTDDTNIGRYSIGQAKVYSDSWRNLDRVVGVSCVGFATEAVVQATSENNINWLGYCETGATAGNDFTGILQGTVEIGGIKLNTKYYVGATGVVSTTGGAYIGKGVQDGVLQIGYVAINPSGYDAIVDASGDGDYTTINAALTAGENRIFVKNGTYNEGTQLLIKTPTVYIQGESSDGVIVNLEKSSTETTYLGYINFDSTDYTEDLIGVINNVTFNAIIGKGNQSYYFVLAETPSVHNNKNITINNCYINFLGKQSGTNITISRLPENEASSTHILSLNNCILVADAHPSATASDVSFRLSTAQEHISRIQKTISNDCRFIMKKTGFNNLSVRGTNNNCSFWINGDDSQDITHMSIGGYNTGCYFDFNGYGTKQIIGILIGCTVGNYGSWKYNGTQTAAVRSWVASGAVEREENHSYSVNDVVRYEGNIYVCTEAHTSDDGGIDYDKFDEYIGYTYITRKARITNSYIGLGGDTIIEDLHDTQPRDSDGIGFISNNEITVSTSGAGVPHIIVLGEERIIGNVITSALYTTEIRLYIIDNCMVNFNSFNIGVDGVVKGVGSNSLILGNIINTYTGTATCTVEAGQNNIADNNIISNKHFN